MRLSGTVQGREVTIEVQKHECRTIGRRQLDTANAQIPSQLLLVRWKGSNTSDRHLFMECVSQRTAIAAKGRDSLHQYKKLNYRQTFRLFPGDQLLIPDGGSGITLDVVADGDAELVLTQPGETDIDGLIEAQKQRSETATTSNRTSPASGKNGPVADSCEHSTATSGERRASNDAGDEENRTSNARPPAAQLAAPLQDRRRKSLSTHVSPHFVQSSYDPAARLNAGLPPVPNARRQSVGFGRSVESQSHGVNGGLALPRAVAAAWQAHASSSTSPHATQHEAVFHQFSAIKQEQRARARHEQSQAGTEGHGTGIAFPSTAGSTADPLQPEKAAGEVADRIDEQPLLLPHCRQARSLTQPDVPAAVPDAHVAEKPPRGAGGIQSESPSIKRSSSTSTASASGASLLPFSPPLSPTQVLPPIRAAANSAADVGQHIRATGAPHDQNAIVSASAAVCELDKTELMGSSHDVVEVRGEGLDETTIHGLQGSTPGLGGATSGGAHTAPDAQSKPAAKPSSAFSQFLHTTDSYDSGVSKGSGGDGMAGTAGKPAPLALSARHAPGTGAGAGPAASTTSTAAAVQQAVQIRVKRRAKLIPDDDDEALEQAAGAAAMPPALTGAAQEGKVAANSVQQVLPAASAAPVPYKHPVTVPTDDDVQIVEEQGSVPLAASAAVGAGRNGPRVKQKKKVAPKQGPTVHLSAARHDSATVNMIDADDDDRLDPEIEADRALTGGVCTVCREDMANVSELGRLPCGHVYCFDCIKDWSKVTNGCCLCKKEFFAIRRVVRLLAPASTVSFGTGTAAVRTGVPRYCRTDMYKVHAKVQRIAGMEAEDAALAAELQAEEGGNPDGDDEDLQDEGAGYAYRANYEEMTDQDVQDAEDNWECRVCKGKDDDETTPNRLLMCDACDSVTHMACLPDPLTRFPDGLWLCDECEVDGAIEYSHLSRPEYIQMRQEKLAQQRIVQKRDQAAAEQEDRRSMPMMSQHSAGSKRSGESCKPGTRSHRTHATSRPSTMHGRAGHAKVGRRARDLVIQSDDEEDSDALVSGSSEDDGDSSSSDGRSDTSVSEAGHGHDDSSTVLRRSIGNRPTMASMQRTQSKPVGGNKSRPINATTTGKKGGGRGARGLKGYDPEDDFVVPEDAPIVQSQWSEDNGMPSDDEALLGAGNGGKKRGRKDATTGDRNKSKKRGKQQADKDWETARTGLGPDDFYKAQLAAERKEKAARVKRKKQEGSAATGPLQQQARSGPTAHDNAHGRANLQAYAYAGAAPAQPSASAVARPPTSSTSHMHTGHSGPLDHAGLQHRQPLQGIGMSMLSSAAGVGKGTRDLMMQQGRAGSSVAAGVYPTAASTSNIGGPVPAQGSARAQQMAAAGVLGAHKELLSRADPVVKASMERASKPPYTTAIYGSQGNNTASGISGSDTSAASPLLLNDSRGAAGPVKSSYFPGASNMAPPPQPALGTGGLPAHRPHAAGSNVQTSVHPSAAGVQPLGNAPMPMNVGNAAAPVNRGGPPASTAAFPRPSGIGSAPYGTGLHSAPPTSHSMSTKAAISSAPGFVSAAPRSVYPGQATLPRQAVGPQRSGAPAGKIDLYDTQFLPTATGAEAEMNDNTVL